MLLSLSRGSLPYPYLGSLPSPYLGSVPRFRTQVPYLPQAALYISYHNIILSQHMFPTLYTNHVPTLQYDHTYSIIIILIYAPHYISFQVVHSRKLSSTTLLCVCINVHNITTHYLLFSYIIGITFFIYPPVLPFITYFDCINLTYIFG